MRFRELSRAIARRKASGWLMTCSLLLSAVMMHPSFGALIALLLNCGVLMLMRKVVAIEAVERFRRRHRIPER